MQTIRFGCMLAGLVLGWCAPGMALAAIASFEDFLAQEADLSQQYVQKALGISEFLADGKPEDALTEAALARGYLEQKQTLINEAELEGYISPSAARSLRANLTAALKSHDKAVVLTQDSLKTKSQKVREFTKAFKKQDDAEQRIQKSDRTNTRLILKSTGPSLYGPDQKRCWSIAGLPKELKQVAPEDCPVEVEFVNPQEGNGILPIKDEAKVAPFNPCSGKFCFLMGTDMGGGRVNVNYDGQTTSRILFNYGSARPYPDENGTPLATLNGREQFAGTYVGSYSGSCVLRASCFGDDPPPCSVPSNGFTSVIDGNGKISVTIDGGGGGSGSLSQLGRYGTGAVGVPFMDTIVNARFKGAILNNRTNSSAKAAGTWGAGHACGSGAGTWSATR